MSNRRSTAVHEAGHAVIGRAVTLVCGGASIQTDDVLECEGHAIIADADTTQYQWELREKFRSPMSLTRARIIAAQAGHEAEAEILGAGTGLDEDDRELASACIEDLGLPAELEDATLNRLRQAARHLVRRHKVQIEAVANALEEQGALTSEEIDLLLPPTFMSRPASWAPAIADAEDI